MDASQTRLGLWRERPLLRIPADVAHFLWFAIQRFFNDRMTQAAGALTYSTLLALVPLLVIAFAVLSGFPAFDTVKARMEEIVFGALVPEVGLGVRTYLTDFTHNASNLTTIGVVALALAAVLLLSTVENTLNQIWRVEHERPLTKRLLIFWAVLTVGPLLLGASFTLTSDFLSTAQRWLGSVATDQTVQLSSSTFKTTIAVLSQSLAFTLLFKIVPARPVRFLDALIGGVFAGIALQGLRWGFNAFLTSSSTYTTIYGAVAIFPIFLVWLYSCWMVIILGAVLSASFPDWWRRRDPMTGISLTPAERLQIAVAVLKALSRQTHRGGSLAQDALTEAIPLDARDEMVEALRHANFVVTTDDDRLCLARDLHRTTVGELAREIGLSLGPADDHVDRPEMKAMIPETGPLKLMLERLRTAEDDILGTSIAAVIGHHAKEEVESDSLVTLRKQS